MKRLKITTYKRTNHIRTCFGLTIRQIFLVFQVKRFWAGRYISLDTFEKVHYYTIELTSNPKYYMVLLVPFLSFMVSLKFKAKKIQILARTAPRIVSSVNREASNRYEGQENRESLEWAPTRQKTVVLKHDDSLRGAVLLKEVFVKNSTYLIGDVASARSINNWLLVYIF